MHELVLDGGEGAVGHQARHGVPQGGESPHHLAATPQLATPGN